MVAADLVRCLRLGKIRSAFIIDHRLILSVEESGGQMKKNMYRGVDQV